MNECIRRELIRSATSLVVGKYEGDNLLVKLAKSFLFEEFHAGVEEQNQKLGQAFQEESQSYENKRKE